MTDEKIFYLIGGPNGSGKTTLARQIVKADNIEFLNLDHIAADRHLSDIAAARALLGEDLPRVLSSGKSFILETTISGTSDIRIIHAARDWQYKVVFTYVFLSSVEQNIERVAQRVKLGGHDVSEEVIRRRYEKSLNNFNKIIPLVDKWQIFYNGESGKSQMVASGTNLVVNVENNEYYMMFQDGCRDATNRRLARLAKVGATEAQLAAQRAGIIVPSVKLTDNIAPNQR